MSIFRRFTDQEIEILRARAQRVAAGIKTEDETAVFTVLLVTVQQERYAMPVEQINSIFERITVVPVPGTPPFIAGISNIRGRIIPVLDLGLLMNIPGERSTDSGVLVLVETRELEVAFRVDATLESQTFPNTSLSALPTDFEAKRSTYLRGLLPGGIALLDIHTILNDSTLAGAA
jgi:purine-binding chemotaxis protein CheW